jgi:hypothetical protein
MATARPWGTTRRWRLSRTSKSRNRPSTSSRCVCVRLRACLRAGVAVGLGSVLSAVMGQSACVHACGSTINQSPTPPSTSHGDTHTLSHTHTHTHTHTQMSNNPNPLHDAFKSITCTKNDNGQQTGPQVLPPAPGQ